MRVLFKHDLAKQTTFAKRPSSELLDAAGNYQSLYSNVPEHPRANGYEPVWEAEYCGIALTDAELLRCLVYIRGELQLRYPRVPQTEPTELLGVSIQSAFFQRSTATERQITDLS